MRGKLSAPLAEYFTATNVHDIEGMVAAFAQSAIVRDEGTEHRGWDAIRDWMRQTIEKYDFRAEPIESSRSGHKTVVLVSLAGKFPGSPITLQYEFTVDSKQISRLEIG